MTDDELVEHLATEWWGGAYVNGSEETRDEIRSKCRKIISSTHPAVLEQAAMGCKMCGGKGVIGPKRWECPQCGWLRAMAKEGR